MRLLHTRKFTLEEFTDTDTPPYAILSHRWGDDEVTFEIFQQELGPKHAGWSKIQGLCHQAAADGFDYCVWLSPFLVA